MANPNKIPVGEVAVASYRFAFGSFLPILLKVGPAFALLSVLGFFITRWQWDAQLAAANPAVPLGSPLVLAVGVVFAIVQAAVIGVAAAALHRMVLFGEASLQLRFGNVEKKFVLASILFGLVFMVPGLIMASVDTVGSKPGGVVILGPLAMIGISIFSLFLMMVFPIIVAEGRIDPQRSIELVSGNWWRLVWLNFLVSLPLVLIAVVVTMAVAGGSASPGAMTAQDVRQFIEAQRQLELPLTALGFFADILFTAIGVGVLSYSYKALNGQPLSATLTKAPPV